ncbi:MAG TPA: malectin domain-containing carbohydrate-binding protein, partial [Pyrinomonadaceae bacterium]|nr:malectin domain-containing carbohydrate-binding protein [Pyrinomonadaceae bacterium]
MIAKHFVPRKSFITVAFMAAAVASLGTRIFAQDLKPAYRINCGGPAVGSYAADAYFEGGTIYTTTTRVDTSGVSNAPSAQVYNTQRYGNFTYSFPNLSPGVPYTVRLHFAETYFVNVQPGRFDNSQAGQRVFTIMVNHKVVLDRFDILASTNANHAVVKEFNTTADNNGSIKIVFQSVVTNAMVNAIEILQNPASVSAVSTAARSEGPSQPVPSIGSKPVTTKVSFNAQNPCDSDDAKQKKGFWDRGTDDLAMADSTFPKDQYSVVLKKADQAIAILKRSIPDLSGIDIKAYRSIRGDPYLAKGPVPFGISAPVFGYGCIPLSATDPNLRGTIVLGDETGTWLHINFNTIPRLPSAGVAHLVNGARVYWMPKIEGQVSGVPLLVPQRLDGWRDEELIITPDGQLPFKPVSREAYLLGRQKAAQAEVDRLSKMPNISPSGMAQRQDELASITNYLNSMS